MAERKYDQLEVGGVYRNNRLQQHAHRKIIRFERYVKGKDRSVDSPFGADVVYVRCDALGNQQSKEMSAWYATFVDWFTEKLETDGKTPAQRVKEFQQRLRDAGRAYCADDIDEAFKLYGITLDP